MERYEIYDDIYTNRIFCKETCKSFFCFVLFGVFTVGLIAFLAWGKLEDNELRLDKSKEDRVKIINQGANLELDLNPDDFEDYFNNPALNLLRT